MADQVNTTGNGSGGGGASGAIVAIVAILAILLVVYFVFLRGGGPVDGTTDVDVDISPGDAVEEVVPE
jgi:hypothetical protein